MKLSLEGITGLGICLCKGCLLVLPVGYGVFLAWQEWRYRESLSSPSPFVAPATSPPPREILDTTAVATVLGLTTQTTLMSSAEPLTLHASFVVSAGLSRALLADAQSSRMYQVGERLPGGSVLRRVEANQVVLWNKGREEILLLQPSTTRFLRRVESPVSPAASAISARYLRPVSGQSE